MKGRLKQLWHDWKEIAECIGEFQSRWLLTVFYFTLLAPFGLLLRFASDPLEIYSKPKQSGWISRRTTDVAIRQGRRQY
jgi:hypothetical protein